MTQPTSRNSSADLAVLLNHCDAWVTPGWRAEIGRRSRRAFGPIPDDREIMRGVCVAIAYSQGARSSLIGGLTETPVFEEAQSSPDPGTHTRFIGRIQQ